MQNRISINTNKILQNEFSSDPITIDANLDPVDKNDVKIHFKLTSKFGQIFPKFDEQTKIIENAVPEPSNGSVFLHQNLMHYLMLAWSNHFSVVISPDMIFYTVLCEIADEIQSDPDAFRHLFTDSTEKKAIMTVSYDAEKIDLNQIIEGQTWKNIKILVRVTSTSWLVSYAGYTAIAISLIIIYTRRRIEINLI